MEFNALMGILLSDLRRNDALQQTQIGRALALIREKRPSATRRSASAMPRIANGLAGA
jgi:hypothetical protein